MKKIATSALAFLLFASFSAIAEPTCTIRTSGSNVELHIADTGVVFNSKEGEQAPADWVTYPGTGRSDRDTAASCSDNSDKCAKMQFFVLSKRILSKGERTHSVDASRKGVTQCRYTEKDFGMTCNFTLTKGMLSGGSEAGLWYGARIAGVIIDGKETTATIAAYQPQGGNCKTGVDSQGNPYTEVPSVKQD